MFWTDNKAVQIYISVVGFSCTVLRPCLKGDPLRRYRETLLALAAPLCELLERRVTLWSSSGETVQQLSEPGRSCGSAEHRGQSTYSEISIVPMFLRFYFLLS